MKKMQVLKAMKEANIVPMNVNGAGENWEIEVKNDKDMKTFSKKVCVAYGFRTGCGSWILKPENTDWQIDGDWNDMSSRCHY